MTNQEAKNSKALDTISRQDAISLPVKPKEDRYFQTQNLDDAYEYGWRDLQGCIEKLPSAQPQRTGKWIQFPNHMAYKCSECGRVIQTTDGQRNVSKHYPFCHCGADMRAEGSER